MSNESRPAFAHRPTTLTVGGDDPSGSNGKDTSDQNVQSEPKSPAHTVHGDDPSESKGEDTSVHNVEEAAPSPGTGPNIWDILMLFGIFIMLIWPWIFFGVVWAKKGIQMNNHVAKVVAHNPQATTYFITLICSIIAMIVSAFFSLSIIRFAQELVSHHKPTRPFHLRVLLAVRHRNWPWGKSWKDVKYLTNKQRWWPAALVIVCILTFPQLISSTTSLITPAPFNRTAILSGTELDFSSTRADCLAWFEANPLSNDCDWQPYKSLWYTNCLGENQMVDVLEAGRGSILELLPNNKQSLAFSQLGAQDGLHFLGPIRGVLPIGPNGVPAFNTLQPSPFDNPEMVAAMTSYNYTLNHQGLTSNITCSYEAETPIIYTPVPTLLSAPLLQYSANCTELGGAEVLTNVTQYLSDLGRNTLIYWACQSAPGSQTQSYSIHLSGLYGYETNVGNITCTVSPIQTALFPVKYQSTTGIFSATEPNATSPITFSDLISHALVGLGDIIAEGQSFQANLVAESVLTFGAKSFNLPPHPSQPNVTAYLQLYEKMIQGILEYEVTYLRLIYSSVSNSPCNRTVTGQLKYGVFGWFVTSANIGFLLPMTIINLAALIALVLAMNIARRNGYKFKPSDPRLVKIKQGIDDEEELPDEWKEKVAHQPTTVLQEYFSSVKATAEGGAEKLAVQEVKKEISQPNNLG